MTYGYKIIHWAVVKRVGAHVGCSWHVVQLKPCAAGHFCLSPFVLHLSVFNISRKLIVLFGKFTAFQFHILVINRSYFSFKHFSSFIIIFSVFHCFYSGLWCVPHFNHFCIYPNALVVPELRWAFLCHLAGKLFTSFTSTSIFLPFLIGPFFLHHRLSQKSFYCWGVEGEDWKKALLVSQ